MFILLVAMVAALAIRLLVVGGLHTSALLYVGIPFLLALFFIATLVKDPGEALGAQFIRHIQVSIIVCLTVSMLLGEGFICVAFLLPIYLFFVSLAYGIVALFEYAERRGTRTMVSLLPFAVVLSAFEGTTPALRAPDLYTVTAAAVTAQPLDEVMANAARPFELRKPRHWLLAIFPMPYAIDQPSMQVGSVHTVYTRYHRWFVANTHEGSVQLEIVRNDPDRLVMQYRDDSSYFANYLQVISSEIRARPIDGTQTEVTLSITFRRKLDPAWYFGPLQRFAVTRMAEFLLDEVTIRND
ncbi:MAG: hypothetical protein AAFZ58_05840 [Pseudomonadota bacterium]